METNNNEDFRNWLIKTGNLERRSAGDVISRRKKLLSIIPNPSDFPVESLKNQLEQELIRGVVTRTMLSGMIRSEMLFRRFRNS
jgi:hypothetical protein